MEAAAIGEYLGGAAARLSTGGYFGRAAAIDEYLCGAAARLAMGEYSPRTAAQLATSRLLEGSQQQVVVSHGTLSWQVAG